MVSDASQTRTLVRGDVLFNEGDPPDALYLVTAGRIAIAMSNPIDRRESVVALMEPGDLFGELGLLDDGPRSAMARALERSELIEVPFGPVREMLDSDPRLLWNFTRLLAGRPDHARQLLLRDRELELVRSVRQLEQSLGGAAGDVEEDRVGEHLVHRSQASREQAGEVPQQSRV